jgi:hypothetical protein
MLRFSSIGVLALALSAHYGCAQSVPAVSGDISVGAGPTSSHSGDTWFTPANSITASADLAVRLGGAGRTRPVVLLGYSFDVFAGKHELVCADSANGGCEGAYFPKTSGPSIGVGLRQTLGQRGLIGVGAGVASYSSSARFAEIDASFRIASHFAIVSEVRYIDLPVSGARAWFSPLTFGGRLY